MTQVVISDTSPIRALDWLGRLELISRLFETVLVPPSVAQELLRCERQYRAIDVTKLPFVEIRTPRSTNIEDYDLPRLDPGEAEAIRLAIDLNADVVLIDEAVGRRCAQEKGLKVLGTLGILKIAKHRGLVAELAPLISELRSGLGFHLSDSLVRDLLKQVGEDYAE